MDELSGYVENIVFTNDENGFTVAKLKESHKKTLTCIVGNMASVQPGESLLCQGEWANHPTFGKQFIVNSFIAKAPCDVIGIQKYLESGLVKGIGPVYAKKIVEKFGAETLDVIDKDPYRLTEVDGIGQKRIEKIRLCWNDQKQIREVMIFLRGHDVSPSFAQKIYKKYGNDSIKIVKDNPYQLSKEVFGIGFKIADRIARKMGFDLLSEKRIEAGIEFALWELSNYGHTCYPKNELLEEIKKILEVDADLILKVLDRQVKEGILIEASLSKESRFIWLKTFYFYEEEIAKNLNRLKKGSSTLRKIDLDKALDWVQKELHIKLAEKQKAAVRLGASEKLNIITGGPGTGKSTIINAILRITQKLTNKIILAAPTGRAAKRMSQITSKKAFTIHALLEYDFLNGSFKKNEDNPLKAHLVIIDESSMIDTALVYHLLKALPDEARLIFVGDIDQLPSVGPGYVLKDMIDSGFVTMTRLKEIFRQAKGSKIITNAHRINSGIFPDISSSYDFKFIEENDAKKIQEKILDLVDKEIPLKYHFNKLDDIQVLSPMKKGLIGTEELNAELQKRLNPSSSFLIRNSKKFQTNDKVMQIKNNYDKHVYNGDIGRIKHIDSVDQEMVIEFEEKLVSYDFSELDEITLSYAVSVHKYQGSECPCIVIPIHTSHFKLLFKNLLYTAVTRGKKLVVIVGTKQAMAMAIKNNEVLKRFTGLKEHIKKVFLS